MKKWAAEVCFAASRNWVAGGRFGDYLVEKCRVGTAHRIKKAQDPLRIIPVIDIKDGLVVRGIAGRRDEYRPVRSVLCDDASVGSVAGAFVEKLGLGEVYVADLNAIAGAEPAWSLYEQIAAAGLDLWVDAGLRDAASARRLAEFSSGGRAIAGVIAGLETLSDTAALASMLEAVGPERLVFSLDLKAGQPLADLPCWQGRSAEQIAATAIEAGIQRMIVLDLHRVGTDSGVGTEPLCRQLRTQHPDLELIAGGGVRGLDDLRRLAEAGCDAALVASALHDGRLTSEMLTRLADDHSPKR